MKSQLPQILVAVLLASLTADCGSEECKSGQIATSSLSSALSGVLAAQAVGDESASELPSEFEYTGAQMRDAIEGTWTDSTADVGLTLAADADGELSYEVGEEGTGCATLANLPVEGSLSDASGTNARDVTGELMAGIVLDGGNVIVDWAGGSCSLAYEAAAGANPAKITSICDLSSLGLYSGNLTLTR